MSEEGRKFGVVIFDDAQDPRGGWYCVAGGAADRFAGAHELSTDTLWWTNISYEHFFRGQNEIWRIPNLRHDKYLVVSHIDVLKEWGHPPDTTDADFTCAFCASAFDRVMRNAWRLISDVFPKIDIESAFRGKTLREDLRCLLPELEYPKGPAAEVFKTGRAWEEFTSTLVKPPRGGRRLMLRRPRLSYAMELLQTPVPRDPFEWISRGDMRSQAADKLDFVLNNTRPCVANVVVRSIQQEVAEIYGFGNAIDKDKRVNREWVAQPEFQIFARYADLDVKSVYIGREYWALMPGMAEPVKDFFTAKYHEYSWAVGVIAECFWRAAMLGEDKNKAGPLRDGEEKAQTSWQGLWIRAADKATMFQCSMRLTERGHAVTGYGLGWVRCTVPEEAVTQFISDGLTLGLVPVFSDVPESAFNIRNLPTWGGDKESAAVATFTVTRNTNMLWNLDKLPLMKPDKQGDYVKRLKERFSRAA
ncbi:hypothetical protein [Bosea sp. RAC05]|uniref:hypothetical protein n=1 Tax=Bosea sp. RAC05 TaxID=1842539 RepID=UPI00083D89CD|nr:hypothetical protein [Bosea sp. RAC05]AOG03145.1 hypothetical protein BSY19_5287 [Bosea sp. RAC05]